MNWNYVRWWFEFQAFPNIIVLIIQSPLKYFKSKSRKMYKNVKLWNQLIMMSTFLLRHKWQYDLSLSNIENKVKNLLNEIILIHKRKDRSVRWYTRSLIFHINWKPFVIIVMLSILSASFRYFTSLLAWHPPLIFWPTKV